MSLHAVQPDSTVVEQTVVQTLTQRYLNRRKQLPSGEKSIVGTSHTHSGEAALEPARSKLPTEEMKGYSNAVQDLFRAVTNPLDYSGTACGLQDELSWAGSLQDSHLVVTETDVTLPSGLNESLGSGGTAAGRRRARRRFDSCPPTSSTMLGTIHQEMMTVYEQLKAERVSQQQWECELQERERRIRQQEEALEDMEHSLQQKHQQEVSGLQALLRDRSKENRRLKSSFEAIKELNENLKRQLNDVSDHNKKLELQSKRVTARLDNLQRKCEQRMAAPPRGREDTCTKNTEAARPIKQREKNAPSGNPSNKGTAAPAPPELLGLLLDWLLDGQTAGAEGGILGQRSPPPPPEVLHKERCSKVLPLLADQLHRTPPSSEPLLLLSLLRFIYWTLRHVDTTTSTQAVALSSTVRRIGEEVSQPAAPQSEDADPRRGGPAHRTCPLYRSPCPHTCILSILIILRTVTQADVLALALGSLHGELACEQSRGVFLRYDGVRALLSLLRAGRGGRGLHAPCTDILTRLTTQSRFLEPFLEACSCEDFFLTVSQLLKNRRMELPVLENISVLLQKLSGIRKNRRLFRLSSLHLVLQELRRTSDPKHTFLCLNLSSILLNLT